MKWIAMCAIVIGAVGSVPLAQSHAVQLPLHLNGAVISAGGIGNPTGTAHIDIDVTRWTSAPERDRLLATLAEKGQDALLDQLSDARSVGTIRFNTGLPWDLRYARDVPDEEGGSHVYLATDRPMSVWEIWNDPRYSQYPFTIIELSFQPGEAPQGSLLLAARVTADSDGRFVSVENYATQPIPITQLREGEE